MSGRETHEDGMTDRLTVTLLSRRSELARLSEIVEEFGARHGLPPKVLFALNLALEEILINVISHGYRDAADHQIVVRLTLDGAEVRAEVEDDGQPFNPLQAPEPDVSKPLEDRPIGGLGIHLTRKMMDGLDYRRHGDKNLLVMRKKVVA
jgi:anti-sigma regulatory factor (Ser/Thr protein kinase)